MNLAIYDIFWDSPWIFEFANIVHFKSIFTRYDITACVLFVCCKKSFHKHIVHIGHVFKEKYVTNSTEQRMFTTLSNYQNDIVCTP